MTLSRIPSRPSCLHWLGRGASILAVILAHAHAHALPSLAEEPKVISGMKNPESAVVGPRGKVYVSLMGGVGKEGDGSIVIVDPSGPTGKITTFATGLDDPKGLLAVGNDFYVADRKKVWKVDAKGKVEVFLAAEAFPRPPLYLKGLAQDGQGNFYVSDSGDRAGNRGAIFRFNSKKEVTLVIDAELTSPQISVPDGLLIDDPDHLLIADSGEGYLYRVDMNTGTPQRMGGGFGGAVGIARDGQGGVFVSDSKNGRLFQVISELEPAELTSEKFRAPAGISLMPDGRTLLIPDRDAGTLTFFPVP